MAVLVLTLLLAIPLGAQSSAPLHDEPGAWELYKPQIIGGIVALVLQSLLIGSLVAQRSRRRRTEARNDAILRALPDLMFLQTTDGVFLDYRASHPGQLFCPPEQFLGKNMSDVLPPALRRKLEPAFALAADATEPVVVEYDLDLAGGTRRFEARLVRSDDDQILTLVRDITDQKRAEAALGESAQRYALATTAGAVGVWDWNFETNELYVDPGLKSLLGFDDAEITNRPEDWGSRVEPADLPTTAAQVKACIDGATDVYEVEHRMVHKDGSARWFLSRGSAIRAADGRLRRLVGTKVDITERKRSADQFRFALEAATTGMVMVSGAGTIVLVNAHVEALFGYRREELIDAPIDMLVPERLPTDGKRELNGLRKDGTEIPLEIGVSPLRTPDGEFVLCSIADITERRQAERERDDLTMHLRDLAGRLIAAQEVERTRIARDLHDDVSQQLAALSIALSGLKRHLPAVPHGTNLEADVSSLQERTKRLAESIRGLSHDLHPDVLRQAGLGASLTAYCHGLSVSQALVVTCSAYGDFEAVAPETAVCLYRIAQEALQNVIKHAQASRAEVRLLRTGDTAELTIVDDGRGFDIQMRKRGTGLGLVSITERVRLAGGTVSIVTALKRGTQVRVQVPITASTAVATSEQSRRFATSA